MVKPKNKILYEKIKKMADLVYEHPSAYKSGYIVRTYKALGGRYEDDEKEKDLERWFKETWKDIGHKNYPVYRPTKRINNKTPLLVNEIDEQNLKQQINKKQIIRY